MASLDTTLTIQLSSTTRPHEAIGMLGIIDEVLGVSITLIVPICPVLALIINHFLSFSALVFALKHSEMGFIPGWPEHSSL
jgi:hypothetical protein